MILEDFKDKHKDSDIYVIASGKSIDFIDKSFFDNKIIIGINQSYKYIMPTYLVRKEHKYIENILKNTDKNVIHFISKGDVGGHLNWIQPKYNNYKNIVVYNHDKNTHKLTNLPSDDKLIVSYSTITTGIHLAAYMGAKNIILVGHDCVSIDDCNNFNNYYDNDIQRLQKNNNQYKSWLNEISSHTVLLKKLLKKKYNCNVLSLNPFVNLKMEGHTIK